MRRSTIRESHASLLQELRCPPLPRWASTRRAAPTISVMLTTRKRATHAGWPRTLMGDSCAALASRCCLTAPAGRWRSDPSHPRRGPGGVPRQQALPAWSMPSPTAERRCSSVATRRRPALRVPRLEVRHGSGGHAQRAESDFKVTAVRVSDHEVGGRSGCTYPRATAAEAAGDAVHVGARASAAG
jgi:hypothetical protein